MLTTPTASVPIRSKQARRLRIGFAVAAGTAAAYGAARLLARKNFRSQDAQHHFKQWLSSRLRDLSSALGLTAELSAKVTKEIQRASRLAMKLAMKSQKSKPDVGDLLRILAEKRLLAMKQRLHRMLDLTDASQAHALRNFYEEVRERIFGTGGSREINIIKTQSVESV